MCVGFKKNLFTTFEREGVSQITVLQYSGSKIAGREQTNLVLINPQNSYIINPTVLNKSSLQKDFLLLLSKVIHWPRISSISYLQQLQYLSVNEILACR